MASKRKATDVRGIVRAVFRAYEKKDRDAIEAVLAAYEAVVAGKRFRNTEVHTIRRGKLAEVEVYFGWSLPHEVRAGTHSDP